MRYEDVFDLEGVPYAESARAIVLLDDRMHFIDANDAALRLLGYRLGELLGRSVTDITPVPEWERAIELWRQFTEAGEQIGDFEVLHSSGTPISVHYHAVAEVAAGVHLSELTPIAAAART